MSGSGMARGGALTQDINKAEEAATQEHLAAN
jgi:hypothetical protein